MVDEAGSLVHGRLTSMQRGRLLGVGVLGSSVFALAWFGLGSTGPLWLLTSLSGWVYPDDAIATLILPTVGAVVAVGVGFVLARRVFASVGVASPTGATFLAIVVGAIFMVMGVTASSIVGALVSTATDGSAQAIYVGMMIGAALLTTPAWLISAALLKR